MTSPTKPYQNQPFDKLLQFVFIPATAYLLAVSRWIYVNRLGSQSEIAGNNTRKTNTTESQIKKGKQPL